MSEVKAHNMMRGISVYANPDRELAVRRYVVAYLSKALPKDYVDAVSHLVKLFGRETVRAVVGPEGA